MSGEQQLQVLLVEDALPHIHLIQALLAPGNGQNHGGCLFTVTVAECLKDALARIDRGGIDAVILDLMLPDSEGLDGLKAVVSRAPSVAVVVLTAMDEESMGVACLREGAQDYLVKGEMAYDLVSRSLRYAVERKRAERELVHEQAARAAAEAALRAARVAVREDRARQRQEIQSLERLSAPAPTPITGAAFGIEPLSLMAPDVFRQMVSRYAHLLDLSIEQRSYKVSHPLSDVLRNLAEEMGFLHAGPRDVVEVHTAALKGKVAGAPQQKAQAYIDEGRLVLLELMGYLVAYYRS